MLAKIKEILKYRQLIATLVTRELKARYRGTILGFLWSFLNPLLLMVVYSIVFGIIMPARWPQFEGKTVYYSIFLFTGILPWAWFSSSMLESANVLIIYGNLIKKIKFPLEALPIMVVVTNMIHFILGLPILILFYLVFGKPLTLWVLLLPFVVLIQFIFTMGFVFFISALTVHFRDLKDILSNLLTLWFFATPIIYPFDSPHILERGWVKWLLWTNPMTHIIEAYQHSFFYGSLPHWKKLSVTVIIGVLFFYFAYRIFDKLRDTFIEEV
jgi:ABC-type polysaccharide/polyol phosphate export permease